MGGMANTSIIHCGRGRERMEVDFYAKLDWQLSLCPLYLRWVGVRGTSSYRLAGSKQSWHVCNQGILDQFNLRWHFTYNWGEIRVFFEPVFIYEVQAGWHFCQADWVKMQFKSCGALFDSSQEPRPGRHLPMLRFLSWWKSHQPPAIHSGIRRIHSEIHRIHRNQTLRWANALSWVGRPIKSQLLQNFQFKT